MRLHFLLILFVIWAGLVGLRCGGEHPPDINELGAKVTQIRFGRGWNSNSNELTGVSNTFDYGITKVYYEISFEKKFEAGGMIKKKWKRDGDQFLEATSFISKNSKRICGEVHHYDNQTMDKGIYEISIFAYLSADGEYKEYPYVSGIGRSFTIK